MYGTVVVPLDPLTGTDAAVPFGAVIARQFGAALELLAVVSPGADADKYHTALDEVAKRHGVDASTRVVESRDLEQGVLDAARDPDVLTCMATRARGAVGELVLGSVSERVVRESHRPVLLVGPRSGPPPERFESMVIGLDGSPLAETILPLAGEWSARLGLQPWTFQVLPPAVPLEIGDDVGDTGYVRRMAARLARPGVDPEWDVARDRHPARAIAAFATGRPAPLIALSTHGRSGLSRLALGSVALDVARRAPVPVLVVRPPAGS